MVKRLLTLVVLMLAIAGMQAQTLQFAPNRTLKHSVQHAPLRLQVSKELQHGDLVAIPNGEASVWVVVSLVLSLVWPSMFLATVCSRAPRFKV